MNRFSGSGRWVSRPEIAEKVKRLSIEIYKKRALRQAESLGIIVADTKFEFGMLNGELILIDDFAQGLDHLAHAREGGGHGLDAAAVAGAEHHLRQPGLLAGR